MSSSVHPLGKNPQQHGSVVDITGRKRKVGVGTSARQYRPWWKNTKAFEISGDAARTQQRHFRTRSWLQPGPGVGLRVRQTDYIHDQLLLRLHQRSCDFAQPALHADLQMVIVIENCGIKIELQAAIAKGGARYSGKTDLGEPGGCCAG